jgi:hypothetical protein
MGRNLFFVPATCWTKRAQIILFSKKKFNDRPIYYTVYERDLKTPPSKPQQPSTRNHPIMQINAVEEGSAGCPERDEGETSPRFLPILSDILYSPF